MLAIAGGKGGCGKTTTTVCLARALAAGGLSPLAVDTDTAMPDLHLVAGVAGGPGLGAVVRGRAPEAVARADPTAPDCGVIPAASGGRETVEALRRLRHREGPVLLDCPAGAGRDATRPLGVATHSLLVTRPTAAAVEDTVKTAAMARELGATPVGVIAVSVKDEGRSTEQLPDGRARELFDAPVLGRVPAASGPPATDSRVQATYRSVAGRLPERNV